MGNSLDRERYAVAIPQLESRIKDVEDDMSVVLDNLLSVTAVSVTTGSVSAGTTKYGYVDATKKGYIPVGIVGWYSDGTNISGINIYNLYLSDRKVGSGRLHYGIRNILSSGTLSATVSFRVLWVKTTL